MSRTRHPEERGTPLAYKRWRRRNVTYKHPPARDVRRTLVDVGAVLFELEALYTHDPEVWLHGTDLVTYADTKPKLGPRAARVDYAEYDPYDPYLVDPRECWDDWYSWRDDYDYDYREDDSYGGYDDVRYLDPREAVWVVAWLCGEVEADEGVCPCCEYDYDEPDDYEEHEGEEEFFAVELPEPKLVEPVQVRALEKKRAGDRYYRTFRRAA